MANRPASVTATFILIAVNALVWLGFGLVVAAGAHPSIPNVPAVKWGMALLALLCSASLLVLLALLVRQRRIAYYLTLALLAIMSLALFADQFGLADLVALVANLVPLALLIRDRAWYLKADRAPLTLDHQPDRHP